MDDGKIKLKATAHGKTTKIVLSEHSTIEETVEAVKVLLLSISFSEKQINKYIKLEE